MSAPAFAVNSARVDPYKAFRFLIKLDGLPVAGISKVLKLTPTADNVEHSKGGDPNLIKGPTRSKFEPIKLERGITYDTGFQQWAAALQPNDPCASFAPEPLLRDVTIELRNEAGGLAAAYTVFGCWISEYQALPNLDAGADSVAIDMIKLEHQGLRRDA